jgi:solute carrier family 45 protein 1/2/4
VTTPTSKSKRKSFFQETTDLWNNVITLPKIIRQIVSCLSFYCPETHSVHYSSWFNSCMFFLSRPPIRNLGYPSSSLATFPLFFYSTIYIGDLYKRSLPAATTDEQRALIDAAATRLGSRALFFASLLSLTVSLVLPAFVTEAGGHPSQNQSPKWWRRICRVPRAMQVDLITMWAAGQLVFAGCMFATLCVTSWLHFCLTECFLYSFTHSVWGSTFIITMTGFPGAIGAWAPFSLVSHHITYHAQTFLW